MRICFFGSYERNYSKNVVLLNGLKQNKVTVIHCYHPNYFNLFHYPSLFWQYIGKARSCDIIYVAFFGHYDVWFGWLIAKIFNKKLVFDPLISIYNTRVEDRHYFKKSSFRAKFYILFERLNCLLVDLVIMDAYEHYKYWNRMFGLKKEKTFVLPLGADENILKPTRHRRNSKLMILWFGSYQPSQGVIKIVQAARNLRKKNVEFFMVGNGIDRNKAENYCKKNDLRNVYFLNTIPFIELVKLIDKADIILGVFGNTVKTRMVIHNKIYQAMAMKKILITQKSPVASEILTDGVNAFLVEPTPEGISNRILEVTKNLSKYQKIAMQARRDYINKYTSKKISKLLIENI